MTVRAVWRCRPERGLMKRYIVTMSDMEHCVMAGLKDVFGDTDAGGAISKIIFNAIDKVMETVLEDDCEIYDEGGRE